MRRLIRAALVLVALTLLAAAGAAWWAWDQLHAPHRGWEGDAVTVEVRPGSGASAILRDLAAAGVLADARLARLYLVYVLGDPPLIAGEYRFTSPLSAPDALAKLLRGEIVTHPVTVVEGLDLEETAAALAGQGFGEGRRFLAAMADPALITDLDPRAESLEGYLYPDTYHFARGTSETEIVAALVRTFRRRFAEVAAPLLDGRSVREVVTLASIVEKEALVDAERRLIAGVYTHRLRRGIALYADPTVIYARKRLGTWDGNLRRVDFQLDSPYNTYRYSGLPPGPICSPAAGSLAAAADPADTPYLYFVSRNDGTHVFAETYAEHQRNVERWQRRYWRERWARERAGSR